MNSIPIIFQNDEILIINKPAGLAVQGGKDIVHSLDKDFSQQLGYKIFLVHRLDKDTAGLMIVAKTPVAAGKWTKLIGSKAVKKEYAAICAGEINPKKGTIKEDLVQHGETKAAVTNYSVEKEWTFKPEISEEQLANGEEQEVFKLCSIRLQLETGRMHQIRIHLAKNNCPICGDDQHGNFKLNKKLRKYLKIKQLLLASVKLTLPLDGRTREFSIELPSHMQIVPQS